MKISAEARSAAKVLLSTGAPRSRTRLRLFVFALIKVRLRSGCSISPANGGSSRFGSPRRIGGGDVTEFDDAEMAESCWFVQLHGARYRVRVTSKRPSQVSCPC